MKLLVRRTAVTLMASSIVLACGFAYGAEDDEAKSHEKLKDTMGWLIGVWEAKVELDGEKSHVRQSYSPVIRP